MHGCMRTTGKAHVEHRVTGNGRDGIHKRHQLVDAAGPRRRKERPGCPRCGHALDDADFAGHLPPAAPRRTSDSMPSTSSLRRSARPSPRESMLGMGTRVHTCTEA